MSFHFGRIGNIFSVCLFVNNFYFRSSFSSIDSLQSWDDSRHTSSYKIKKQPSLAKSEKPQRKRRKTWNFIKGMYQLFIKFKLNLYNFQNKCDLNYFWYNISVFNRFVPGYKYTWS